MAGEVEVTQMKARLHSADVLLDNEDNFENGLEKEMLRYAGKEVTVTHTHLDDDVLSIFIKDDNNYYQWQAEMFEKLPKHVELLKLDLNSIVHDNSSVLFDSDGNMTIGCTTVEFSTLEQMYQRALEVRDSAPKPKKRKSKKKKK